MKILIFSHGHPDFSKGGAELASYHLFNGINQTGEHEAWYVARAPQQFMHLGITITALSKREYLVLGDAGIDYLTTNIPLGYDSDFASIIRSIQPDVVHFHHYVLLGVEMIRAVKQLCPEAKILVTLHEYIAICLHNGQMVKVDGRKCYKYSPRECTLCFPKYTPEDIFLRERYIKTFFELVDQFISPSEFLQQRYIAWGIKADLITVIENGLPEEESVPVRPLHSNNVRGRFAYFGQVNPFKGVDVVLEAFTCISPKTRKQVTLDIFGSGLNDQSVEYQEKIITLVKKCKGVARLHGPYESKEMGRLMSEIDWVVMGSIWWENSPLVIQEAYKFGRPVICPDIGGMAEKVQHGKGGLNYRASDSVSLAILIQRIIDEPTLFDELCKTLPAYPQLSTITDKHLKLYHNISTKVSV